MPPQNAFLPRWRTVSGSPVPDTELSEQETPEIDYANETLTSVRKTLDRLRKWHGWGVQRETSLRSYLLSKILPRRPPCPSQTELKRLALFFFPLRNTGIKVDICDFGEDRFETCSTTVDKLEPYTHLLASASSMKDSFVNAGTTTQSPVVRYVNAGRDLSCEATSLRDKQYLQDQLDVFNILRGLDSLMDDFDIPSTSRTEEQPSQPNMNRTMESMAEMYDLGTSFWHLCLTDIPWQLGEGTRTSLLDADLGINPASTIVQNQFLSRHPSYENAVLVRSLFQCYQRTGFVLTMSPLAGVNYLNRSNLQEIQSRPGTRAANDRPSFIRYFMQKYRQTGTTQWPIKSTEWFVVELLTQLLITPCHSSWSAPVPGIQNAYAPAVRELKSRQTSKFQRNESVNLVREYLSCIDEVAQLLSISERKIDILHRLKRDFEDAPQGRTADDSVDESDSDIQPVLSTDNQTSCLAIRSIDNAINRIKVDHEELPKIMDDLKGSLHDAGLPALPSPYILTYPQLFQLRTIEQNELAIIAESNNKAILVFTVVTIIFLPLSFFTSYFGMNLQNTSAILKDQGVFWGICGSITLVIVVFTLVYGFKDRLYNWVWGDRHAPGRVEYYYRPAGS
ncbi:MAG: hypothetical protein Q9204_005599 [Flavoplaca sp. TL-2023a]